MPQPMPAGERIAAVRGAVSVAANTADDILEATARLLAALAERNAIDPSRIVSALFTATADLDADYPARAARRLGWRDVPLLCAREIPVPGGVPRVVRVLLTVSVPGGRDLIPVYLDEAAALRPDLPSFADGPQGRAAPAAAGGSDAAPERGRRVALVGLGQIGGSIGLALGRSRRWWRVGYDLDGGTREAARARGAVDECAGSLAAACAGADLAVLATPVDTLPAVVDGAARTLPAGAALVDTGGARGGISEALGRAVARGIRAVGGHPIAGSEGRGLAAARPDLFAGAPFALVPAGAGVPEMVADLVRDLGARPLRVDPGDHDRALARTSHLPYLIACALLGLGDDAARRDLSGPAFRDMTRIAASDERVALATCRVNAREVAAAWRELRDAVEERVAGLA